MAEQSEAGSHLVFVRETGERFASLTEPARTVVVDALPAWSPDGLHVAFVSSRESGQRWSLWLADVLEGTLTRLTEHEGFDAHPSWSPDGAWIAFSSDAGGSHDLWRVRVADRKLEQITHAPGSEVEPAWSPDGKRLAYVRIDDEGRASIWSRDMLSGDERQLTDGPADRTPAWFPDSQRLVFSAPADGRGDRDLHAMDTRTGARRVLVSDPLGDETGPVVSANGRHVLATSVLESAEDEPLLSTLVVVDLAEEQPRLRALYDRYLGQRHGVTAAPVALDADALSAAPFYSRALESWLERAVP